MENRQRKSLFLLQFIVRKCSLIDEKFSVTGDVVFSGRKQGVFSCVLDGAVEINEPLDYANIVKIAVRDTEIYHDSFPHHRYY